MYCLQTIFPFVFNFSGSFPYACKNNKKRENVILKVQAR